MSEKHSKAVEVDMIIISWAKNKELLQETHTGLKTLFDSEDSNVIKFNAIVVETDTETSYDDFETNGHTIKTIYPKITHPDLEFGYHTYLNIGLEHAKSEWTCLCNNDLVFQKNWALKILQIIYAQRQNEIGNETKHWEYVSASPANPREKWHKENLGQIVVGYGVRQHVAGWCLFQSRNIFEKIGKLEERVRFWFCDNWYSVAMQYNKIPHIFVGNSIVEHHDGVEGTTTKEADLTPEEKHKVTFGAGDEFREIVREMLGDPSWGRMTDEQQKEFEKKTGKKYY